MSKKESGRGALTFATAVLCFAMLAAVAAAGYIVWSEYRKSESGKISLDKLPYRAEVSKASEAYGVEEARIYAVIQVESSFISDALSDAGAMGLMQMMPSTYEDQCFARGESFDEKDLNDPARNIDICTYYLQKLYNLTGSWDWAHTAYNSGIGNVLKWQKEGYTPSNVPSDRAKKYLERIKSAYDAYSVVFAAQKNGEQNNSETSDI